MNAQLEPRNQISAYDEFRGQLAQLKADNEKVVFDYADPKGNKEARSYVYRLRQTKAAVDKRRKDEKAASLEYSRRVDAEAKEIIAEVEAMIEVHEAPLREIEARERERVAAHERNLQEIIGGGERSLRDYLDLPLDAMRDRLTEIEAEPITEARWEEFTARAAQAKDLAIGQLREAIAKREKHEAEQAELARLRQETEERRQREHEERIAREAEERARREAETRAERRRQDELAAAEAQRQAEQNAARQRELEQQAQIERAQREKAEAEARAERAREEERQRIEAEQRREREEAERRERNRRHRAAVNNAAVAALVAGGVPDEHARRCVELIAKKEVPNVNVSY